MKNKLYAIYKILTERSYFLMVGSSEKTHLDFSKIYRGNGDEIICGGKMVLTIRDWEEVR